MTHSRSLHVTVAIHRVFPHGGLQRDALSTARACMERGHRVTLLAQRVEGDVPDGIEVVSRPVAGLSNHGRAQSFGSALAELREEARPDVVIGFDKIPGLDIYFAGDRCFVERVHTTRPRWSRWTPRYRAFKALEEAVFAKGSSTSVLLLRESQRGVFQHWYGTESERFEVLPPGVSRARVRPADGDERGLRMRERLGIAPTDPVMLFVGSDYARKGLDRAVRALGEASRSSESARPWLIAAGAGDPAPFVRAARAVGAGDRFLALGPRDDVLDLMLAADVLVHPARTEAGGVVLLEAIVAGTPVIASSVCGYGSLVTDAGAGILIPGSVSEDAFARDFQRALAAAFGPSGAGARCGWRRAALDYAASHPELFEMHAHIVRAIERCAENKEAAR